MKDTIHKYVIRYFGSENHITKNNEVKNITSTDNNGDVHLTPYPYYTGRVDKVSCKKEYAIDLYNQLKTRFKSLSEELENGKEEKIEGYTIFDPKY